MSEIKFACPHCRQHIACDGAYSGERIACPSCATSLVVPRLTASDRQRAGGVFVASIPAPARRVDPHFPTGDFWTEEEWERHAAETPGSGFGESLPWLVPILVLLPLLAVLLATTNGQRGDFVAPLGVVLGIICSGLAAWLAVRNLRTSELMRRITGVAVMLGLMGMQLGVLGVAGCCASIDSGEDRKP